jgi:hypothetical protein
MQAKATRPKNLTFYICQTFVLSEQSHTHLHNLIGEMFSFKLYQFL